MMPRSRNGEALENNMLPVDSAKRKTNITALLLAVVGGGFAFLLWWQVNRKETIVSTPELPEVAIPKIDERQRRLSVFETEIRPLIDESCRESHKSIERCSDRIRDMFKDYRSGIDPFVQDITSTWTRLGVLSRMPAAWWKEDDRIDKFIREKFEEHLFSEGELNRGMTEAMEMLREDLMADRVQLLSQVKASISTNDLPDVVIPENLDFEKEVVARLQSYATSRAEDSVYQGLASLVTSEVASAIAASMIVRVVGTMGASATAGAAAAGGATASGAAAGAGGGSLAGPAGTAIGLGVGLVAGIAIDWWMTSRFQTELQQELRQYLFRLEAGILHGGPGNAGLESSLEKLIDDVRAAEQEVFQARILGSSTT